MNVTDLHREYARLTKTDPVSIRYFLTDIAGDASTDPSLRITSWVRNLHKLEAFIKEHDRHPRENRRTRISCAEQRLADWVRFQRRPATREGHCRYQRLRLETIEGWRWAPISENWASNARAYEAFRTAHARPPRYRSTDNGEKALAAWALKQRHRHRSGSALSADQVGTLIRLNIITDAEE